MKKKFKFFASVALVCSIIIGTFSMSGCSADDDSLVNSSGAKTKLLTAINNLSYSDYLALAFPTVQTDIEKERTDKGMSEDEYIKYVKESILGFDGDKRIAESDAKKLEVIEYDSGKLGLVKDKYIAKDGYVEIDRCEDYIFSVRDAAYSDNTAPEIYVITLKVATCGKELYFLDYSISDEVYVENNETLVVESTEAE